MKFEEHFKSLFTRLYGKKEASICLHRLKNLFDKYDFDFKPQEDERLGWTEEDAILITYGDVITDDDHPEKKSLALLEDFDFLVKGAQKRGGFVTYKQNSDGTKNPYELNILYFDAFEKPG